MTLKELMHTKIILNIRKKRFWAGILLVQFFLFFLLSRSLMAIEFFSRLFEIKKVAHQFLASKIPFSVGDLFYIFLSLGLIYLVINLFNKRNRSKSGFQLLMILNVFYFIYQIFWGMLYFQEPLLNKLSPEEITITEAKKLSNIYLNKCIKDRKKVAENKEGVFIVKNINVIENAILENQKTLPANLIEKEYTEINAMKPSIFKFVMSYSGILGYYNPFTSEAQYNADLPSTYLPFTLAHESSHQLGYAREQEANFVGFLIGKNSKNAALKYSTDFFALKSLLRYIENEDPKFVEEILQKFSPGMKRDLKAERIFNEKHQGFLDKIFAVTNNLFLKSNQQEGSITYSYFTEMMIKYERQNP